MDFIPKRERIFRLLISVSGVGTSTAKNNVIFFDPQQVVEAISTNNVSIVQSVKGIGSKTAQRLIIELRDKILKFMIWMRLMLILTILREKKRYLH